MKEEILHTDRSGCRLVIRDSFVGGLVLHTNKIEEIEGRKILKGCAMELGNVDVPEIIHKLENL